jgi:hypothetical protein
MNHRKLILAAITTAFCASAMADNFGSAAVAPKPAVPPVAGPQMAAPSAVVAPAAGPQAGDAFRIVKPDGATLIAQGVMGANVATGAPINVSDKDAFLVSGGKCAFNVKYDEVSSTAALGTTNRLYSNDKLIAQNTKIDLAPNVLKTIWTQPYLTPGVNNVRVVVNADAPLPSTKWVRVNVSGTCGAVAAPAPAPVTPPPVVAPPVVKPAPPAPVTPPPVVRFAPGSAEWNNLNNMWGYSNYAVTQLKTANYARYAELVKLNAAVTAVINAKTVDQGSYNSLITSWNTFVTEPKFASLMAAVVAGSTGKK